MGGSPGGRVPRRAGPRAGGSHPSGFQLAQRNTPQAQAFPGEFRAVRASTGGGAGLPSIRRAARPLWATGLCCWNDGACLPACAAAAAAPRWLPRRPRRVGMCMRDVLEGAGVGGIGECLLCSPKTRDPEGVGCITICAPPPPRTPRQGKL